MSVPGEVRSFTRDPELARKAGRKGGIAAHRRGLPKVSQNHKTRLPCRIGSIPARTATSTYAKPKSDVAPHFPYMALPFTSSAWSLSKSECNQAGIPGCRRRIHANDAGFGPFGSSRL